LVPIERLDALPLVRSVVGAVYGDVVYWWRRGVRCRRLPPLERTSLSLRRSAVTISGSQLWFTAVWAASMTLLGIPSLLPSEWAYEVRNAVGFSLAGVTAALIAWPHFKVTSPLGAKWSFRQYAVSVAAVGAFLFLWWVVLVEYVAR